MDEYGNDDDWTSNYDENAYYSPDDQQQSVATVSGDSNYDLPNTYDEPNTYGYGNNNLGTWGPSQEADDSLYNYQSDYPEQGYNNIPGQESQGILQQLFGGKSNPMAQANSAPAQQGGITSLLSQLFGGGSKLLGAMVEGKQNKQKQAALNTIAKSPTLDPFGQTQRNFYQEQAQQVVKDPYSAPIVKAQTDELLRQANIRNAAHGRTLYQGGPELVAAQAGIAQKYLDQMLHAGGSQMSPDGKTIAGLQAQASQAGTNGYASPLASAINYAGQDYQNQNNLDSILNALAAQKGK